MQIGRFRLAGHLGKGGMGIVYRGVDVESGREVAVKTIGGVSGGLLDGLRREIEALRALSHPGIVRVLDVGVSDGLPWYAMELIAGETLAEWMQSSRSKSLPAMTAFPAAATMTRGVRGELGGGEGGFEATMMLGFQPLLPDQPTVQDVRGYLLAAADIEGMAGALLPLLNLVCLVCDALGYLHGEGLVHCDLKPQNVLVRQDGRPVLVDFGLTGRGAQSRDVLEGADMMAGSVLYMAPEQIRGEAVDPRADVYGLGCLLYEMVSGRPPFMGSTPNQVLMAHLSERPASLVEVAQVPAMLDELIQSMLEKDPRDRVGHVSIVAAALRELGADVPGWASAPPHKVYLYRPRTVGRTRELAQLQRWLMEVRGQRSVVSVLEGPTGGGKTRVLTELASIARGKGFRVYACRSEGAGERRSRLPFGTLRAFLTGVVDYCQEIGESGTERVLGAHGRWLAPYAPGMAELVGQEGYPPAEALSPELSVSRVFASLKAVMKALSADFPLALLFDDLQWADELTVAFLTHLTAQPLDAAVLILGALRQENVGELAMLLRVAEVRHVSLGPLAALDVETMVADMLAVEAAPMAFVRVLMDRSAGNPFLVAEYLYDAVEANLLLRDPMGRWQVRMETDGGEARDFSRLPLPASLRGLIESRLGRLSQEALAVVSAASVLGRELYPPWVAAMTGLSGPLLDQALRELRQAHVLESAGPWMQFVNETMRQATYDRLGPEGQAALHGRAGQALEVDLRHHVLDRAMIAEHFLRAGLAERAAPHLLFAARQARRGFALEDADRLYVQYLAISPSLTLERYMARQELAREILFQRRDNVRALEHLEIFAAEAEQLGDERALADALRLSGVTCRLLGRTEEARGRLERSVAIMEALDDQAGVAKVLNSLGNMLSDLGRYEASREVFERALAIARRLGNLRDEALFLGNLGLCLNYLGRFGEGAGHLTEALALHRQRGDLDGQSMTATNLAGMLWLQGKVASAYAAFTEVLGLNERVQNLRHLSVTCDALGAIAVELGHLSLGEERLARALELSRVNRHVIGELTVRLNWTELAFARGAFDVAQAHLEVAEGLARDAELVAHLARCKASWGKLLFLSRRTDAAGPLQAAVAALDDVDALDESAYTRVLLAEALFRQGRLSACREHIELAVAALQALPYAHDRLRSLVATSRLTRWLGDPVEQVQQLLALAGRPLAGEDPLGMACLLYELGHVEMMQGRHPTETIEATPALVLGAEPAPYQPWTLGRARFERALSWFVRGQALWCGEGVDEGDGAGLRRL